MSTPLEDAIEQMLVQFPSLTLGEQAALLAAYADCHALFPEIDLKLFLDRLPTVVQDVEGVSVPVFTAEAFEIHKKALGQSRISDKTKKTKLIEYCLTVEKIAASHPGVGFTFANFLAASRPATTAATATTPAPAAEVPAAPPSPGTVEQPAVAPPATVAPPAVATAATPAPRRRATTAAAPAATGNYAPGSRCQFSRNGGPTLQGSLLSVAAPAAMFMSDDGEAIAVDVSELQHSVVPAPVAPVPVESYVYKMAVDEKAYIQSILGEGVAVNQPLQAVLRCVQINLGENYQAQIVLTNDIRPFIDPYVMPMINCGGDPVQEIPPREYSVLGYYWFTLEGRVVQLSIEPA